MAARALGLIKKGLGALNVQTRSTTLMSPKPKLVSFADGAFTPRRRAFQKEAEKSGFFSSVNVHHAETLPSDFLSTHGEFLANNARGFGYWIWKPVVILQALEASAPDELVVYLDAGFSINRAAPTRFREYLEIAQDHESKMLSFMNIYTECHWTKADLFAETGFSLNSVEAKTSQLGSGFLVLVNTQSNRDLIRQWAEIAVKDGYRFSDDSPSTNPNHELFQEHRHDQSIASLLRKAHGTAITHYEVQGYPDKFEKFRNSVPAWATRLRK